MIVSGVDRNNSLNQSFTSLSVSKNLFSDLYKGVKKGSVPKTDLSAFVFDIISGGCYLVGGTGLLYDFAHEKTRKNKSKIPQALKSKSFTKQKSFNQFIDSSKPTFGDDKTDKKSQGVQTIVPQTKFAKTGLKFARAAVLVAGFAGVFNGIALDLPLLALGEGVTSLSAPIIETPVGTGIFGFGLALINLARVLDKDPEFKLNRDKFNHAPKKEKFKMLSNNVIKTFAELGHSTAKIFKNLFGLVTPKAKESLSFFKNEMFSMKPTAIVMQEMLTKEGKLVSNKIRVNNPYLMHLAAFGLSVASISLMVSNMAKARKTEKASLRAYGVSNGIDNVALSKWGVETYMNAKGPSQKASGGAFAIAGVSLLAGQAGIDKNWGRGLMWNGIGIILLGFGAQTGANVFKAMKTKTINPIVVREWKVMVKNKILDSKLAENIENKLSEVFKSSVYNKNSEEVLAQMKNKFGDLKEFAGLEIRKISDTKDVDAVKAQMLKLEQKLYS